jgi:glutamyl-tRNA synthetase
MFTVGELSGVFDLGGISGGNAVFNQEKLDWFNQQYIMRLETGELARRLQPLYTAAGLWDASYLGDRRGWFSAVLELLKPRAKRLDEVRAARKGFSSWTTWNMTRRRSTSICVRMAWPGTCEIGRAFAALETFDPASLETALRGGGRARGIKAGTLIHAVRRGRYWPNGQPRLFEVLSLLGRERVRRRLTLPT